MRSDRRGWTKSRLDLETIQGELPLALAEEGVVVTVVVMTPRRRKRRRSLSCRLPVPGPLPDRSHTWLAAVGRGATLGGAFGG